MHLAIFEIEREPCEKSRALRQGDSNKASETLFLCVFRHDEQSYVLSSESCYGDTVEDEKRLRRSGRKLKAHPLIPNFHANIYQCLRC